MAAIVMSAAGTGPDSLLQSGNEKYGVGDYQGALEYYFRYLDACRDMQDRKGEGEALRKIGDSFRATGDYWRCLEYLEQAKAIALETGDQQLLVRVYNRMAADYYELRENDLAFRFADSSLALSKKLEYTEFQANNLNILGAIARSQEDHVKAISYLEQSMELQRSLGDTADIPLVLNNIASTYLNLKQYQNSILMARKSLGLSRAAGSLAYQQYSTSLLKDAYLQMGRYDSAYHYFEQQRVIVDSLNWQERRKEMAETESKYSLKAKEQENAALRKQQELQAKASRQLWGFTLGLVAVLVLLVTSLAALLISRRQRAQAHALLQDEMHKVERQKTELQEQAAALEENNRIRDRLFSVIAHDLRSPLNSLQGILSLLKAGALNEDELRALLKGLTDRVDSTSMLVDNLLNWAKSQLQGFQVQSTSLDLGDVLEKQISFIQAHADTKGIRLVNKVLYGTMVTADPNMLDVIIRNLLNNAVKFTPKGGEVQAFVEAKGDSIRLHVRDNGVGMTKEVMAKLFDGVNHSSMGTSRESGSGLGLMLVKEFVERNKGTLDIASTPGQGTTITVGLPRG